MFFFLASTTELSSNDIILKMQNLLLEAENSPTSPKQEVLLVSVAVLYLIIINLRCSYNFMFISNEHSKVRAARSEKYIVCAS